MRSASKNTVFGQCVCIEMDDFRLDNGLYYQLQWYILSTTFLYSRTTVSMRPSHDSKWSLKWT